MIKKIEIQTPLGYKLGIREFLSKNSNNVVIICSATGVLQNYYEKFASFLQENNFTVYTFDYGGIGESLKNSLSKFNASASDWATNDIENVLLYAKEQNPNAKINVIAHSIGGQLLGLAPSYKIINKIILVASQSGYWKLWKGKGRLEMFFNWYILFPFLLTFFKYLPSKRISGMENLPKQMAAEWSNWGRHKKLFI